MIQILKKLFIKDYTKTEKQEVRLRYGILAGILGIISNLLLFVSKIVIGILASSITIIADAVNNLSDTATSAVTSFGFKMSARPADPEHPYGHARYEHITALIIAIVVMFIGGLLAKESAEKLINPVDVTVDAITLTVLALAIGVKVWQMFLYKNFSKTIKSDALKAASVDSRNDIITTSTVLVAIVLIMAFPNAGFSIDGVMGLLVSLFIIASSINLIKDTITPLLGEKPDKELVSKIREKILSYEGVLGIHDLMIHCYGMGSTFAIVHVEVSSGCDVLESHDLIDIIERDFKDELNIHLSIHMDPIETDNPLVEECKQYVEDALKIKDERLNIHDFRMVVGKKHTNILFDVDVPYGLDITVEEIERICRENVDYNDKCYYVITIDIVYNDLTD